MDVLWALGATGLIVVAGYGITILVIHPIRNLQAVQTSILHLLTEHKDVYGIARDRQKYQAREVFRQSVSRLEEAKGRVPLYWLWEVLGPVPKQQKLEDAKAALLRLAGLAVQIIDHQADLSKRQIERAQVMKAAAQQETIIKDCLVLKDHPVFRDT
ncbi:MAG: hypothetical protein ACPGYT_00555 [Nitrospirales bacterium]